MSGIVGGAGSKSGVIGDTEGHRGVWTPILSDASSGGNVATFNALKGTYTKVGSLCLLTCFMNNISNGSCTAGNALYIQGQPFKSWNAGYKSFTGAVFADTIDFEGENIVATMDNNADFMYLIHVKDNTNEAQVLHNDVGGGGDIYFSFTYITA